MTNGNFAVTLDFVNCSGCICPTCFNGGPRFLAIAVRPTGGGSYTPLTERQPITSTPYAVKSMSAANATTADGLSVTCVNCVTSSQIASVNGSAVTGTIPVGSVPDLGASYIKNTTSPQSSSNFNISGSGRVGSMMIDTNLAVGNNASITGSLTAASITSSGNLNGNSSTITNLTATNATVTGTLIAPTVNTSGNISIGGKLGIGTAPSTYKLEVLDPASNGLRVQTNGAGGAVASFGGNGAFFVDGVGTVGGRFTVLENGKVGIGTGTPARQLHLSTAGQPSFMMSDIRGTTGNKAGTLIFDAGINLTSPGWVFQDVDDAGTFLANRLSIFKNGNVGIGTTTPASKLHVFGNGILRVNADSDLNAGFGLRLNNTAKWSVATVDPGNFQIYNDAIGQNAFWIDTATNNVGIGITAPTATLHIDSGEFLEFLVGASETTPKLLVRQDGVVKIGSGSFTGSPDLRLVVNGVIATNLASGGVTPICQSIQGYIAACSSSIRYKDNVSNFSSGLDLMRRLRPVSFNWKNGGVGDMGLIAEEVADVEPLLVTHNDKGEVEGVKYDRVGVVAINAIKEQQAEIKALKKTVEHQQKQIEALKKLACATNRHAGICKH